MSLAGQRLQPNRYSLIPRTLTFLTRQDQVLLLRLSPDRGEWAGLLNGVGGHVEPGEDPLQSARREIEEETGLSPSDLRLAGVVIIDTGSSPGIGLYVFVGKAEEGKPRVGSEGTPEWISLNTLDDASLVEDLPILLPKALASYEKPIPFSARYEYDEAGALRIRFSE
ncbi:MAG TPA: NUDIX domain-containing protein [Anaerolineae bacterium]|nr:NUDIX domain-containing protein [Anaerolineae bacterium]